MKIVCMCVCVSGPGRGGGERILMPKSEEGNILGVMLARIQT